jgi:glycosyltransferase involved in cell wall biosynthesis
MNFLFPYMARWQTANHTRYHALFKSLTRLGHKVVVLQPPRWDSAETNFLEVNSETTPGVTIIEIPVPDWLWKSSVPLEKLIKKGSYSVMTQCYLKELIHAYQIDVLMLYNLPQCLMLLRSPCFCVFDVADDLLAMFSYELGRISSPGLVHLGEVMFRSMLRRSDLNLVVSEELQLQIEEPTTLLPNGVDLEGIGGLEKVELPVGRASLVVGYMGAFEYFVDMDMVLDTAAMMPDVAFWLVGGGRDFSRIKGRVAKEQLKNVYLPGPVDHQTGLAMMAATDVCLLPRCLDAFSHAACPLKLFEYAALGKPIVSTPVREVQRIAKGFAFFVRDHREMKRTITQVMENPDSIKPRVKRGLELVKNTYNWQVLSGQFIESLEKAMNG